MAKKIVLSFIFETCCAKALNVKPASLSFITSVSRISVDAISLFSITI